MLNNLKEQLDKYGIIIQCDLYENDKCLEIKIKNNTGRRVTYQNIVTNFISPYYPQSNYKFQEGYFKGTFCKLT